MFASSLVTRSPHHDANCYARTIIMHTSLNFDGMCRGVFGAYLTNERGQRICFPRRRLRAKLAKEEYATTWQEED